ncbi:MAG TPA: flagellar biosynthetic protein FliO [Syntrophales bacterium]|nr:flagellar biosynthetic protein FliO [Syntrophales bacterium]HOX93434.1 flagellar biosynthetic protein FliO [Syntrophales bacterium]HPI56653.1 flagellar biosynthetic protein FliO [Syntrophales bacterium]HPN24921.1 flagellar biosynthetic protein FliO [Syntrophales bacterium]HQM29730.1 flagellar biosynthetic protein FliO [Syntrophales bacterium]
MSSWEFILSILKMMSALALVLGLMVVAMYVLKKFMNRTGGGIETDEFVKIVSTRYLGPKNSIVILDVLGRVIVVGISNQQISLLTEIDDRESLDRLQMTRGRRTPSPALMDQLTLYKRKLKALSFMGKNHAVPD